MVACALGVVSIAVLYFSCSSATDGPQTSVAKRAGGSGGGGQGSGVRIANAVPADGTDVEPTDVMAPVTGTVAGPKALKVQSVSPHHNHYHHGNGNGNGNGNDEQGFELMTHAAV